MCQAEHNLQQYVIRVRVRVISIDISLVHYIISNKKRERITSIFLQFQNYVSGNVYLPVSFLLFVRASTGATKPLTLQQGSPVIMGR